MDKFIPFSSGIQSSSIPPKFELMAEGKPHALCVLAAKELQHYLETQEDWVHNFGLKDYENGTIVGKMFGVLVVKTSDGELGYLTAFSGKLAGTNQHSRFVPPIFDLLEEGSFFNVGMQELTRIIEELKMLKAQNDPCKQNQIAKLKLHRSKHSVALQKRIFEQYHFLNRQGEQKGLYELFKAPMHKNPPAGAGECAGPKLLQYAFRHKMQPVALAEFWWGLSPKSANWKHGAFYACCKEKCEPILAFMLS